MPLVNLFREGVPWDMTSLSLVESQITNSPVATVVTPGAYYIQASDIFLSGETLEIDVTFTPPPANDSFAGAQAIAASAVPFATPLEFTGASTEPGEPIVCNSSGQVESVWYSFSPTAATTLTAGLSSQAFGLFLGAWSGGPGLESLAFLGCGNPVVTIQAVPGATYYFQVAHYFGIVPGDLRFTLGPPPPPRADLAPSSPAPSTFSMVTWFDLSDDPAGIGIASWHWDFGDGATSDVRTPEHRYSADGDYTVTLSITTLDGRTASATRGIRVETHDVRITKVTVPKNTKRGQTIQVRVTVASPLRSETVTVDVGRNPDHNGAPSIGRETAIVNKGKLVEFRIPYTVTAADAANQKVTFLVLALLPPHAHDGFPSDNQAIETVTVK